MDAQKSRGLELDKGNPISRIKKFVPILDEISRKYNMLDTIEVFFK